MHKRFMGKLVLRAVISLHPYEGERDLGSPFYFNPSFSKERKLLN